MPDILKISGRCGSRIADVNGVLKGNIQDVNNVGGFVTYSPPLDTYGSASAAYSVRLLRTAYTGDIMRVRRASDNVEADVGFDGSNELSLTSPISNTSDAQSYTDFADFVDHTGTPTDAFVRYWYDQASTNDAGQATAGSQPQIYDATTGLITENGKPAIQVDTSQYMEHSFTSIAQPLTISMVYKTTTIQFTSLFRGDTASPIGVFTHGSSNSRLDFGTDLNITANNNAQMHTIALANGTSSVVRVNGVQDVSGDAGTNAFDPAFIMGQVAGGTNTPKVQEMVFWGANQSSNFTGIECNLNGYFKIY